MNKISRSMRVFIPFILLLALFITSIQIPLASAGALGTVVLVTPVTEDKVFGLANHTFTYNVNMSGTFQYSAFHVTDIDFATNNWNTSAIVNDADNTFNYTFADYGTYSWNVEVWNATESIVAVANYSIIVQEEAADNRYVWLDGIAQKVFVNFTQKSGGVFWANWTTEPMFGGTMWNGLTVYAEPDATDPILFVGMKYAIQGYAYNTSTWYALDDWVDEFEQDIALSMAFATNNATIYVNGTKQGSFLYVASEVGVNYIEAVAFNAGQTPGTIGAFVFDDFSLYCGSSIMTDNFDSGEAYTNLGYPWYGDLTSATFYRWWPFNVPQTSQPDQVLELVDTVTVESKTSTPYSFTTNDMIANPSFIQVLDGIDDTNYWMMAFTPYPNLTSNDDQIDLSYSNPSIAYSPVFWQNTSTWSTSELVSPADNPIVDPPSDAFKNVVQTSPYDGDWTVKRNGDPCLVHAQGQAVTDGYYMFFLRFSSWGDSVDNLFYVYSADGLSWGSMVETDVGNHVLQYQTAQPEYFSPAVFYDSEQSKWFLYIVDYSDSDRTTNATSHIDVFSTESDFTTWSWEKEISWTRQYTSGVSYLYDTFHLSAQKVGTETWLMIQTAIVGWANEGMWDGISPAGRGLSTSYRLLISPNGGIDYYDHGVVLTSQWGKSRLYGGSFMVYRGDFYIMYSLKGVGPGYERTNMGAKIVEDICDNDISGTGSGQTGEPQNFDVEILNMEGCGNWLFAQERNYIFKATYLHTANTSLLDEVGIRFSDGTNTMYFYYNNSRSDWTNTSAWKMVVSPAFDEDRLSADLKEVISVANGTVYYLYVYFYVWITNHVLDELDIDIWMYCSDTQGLTDGWEMIAEDYFHIYNLGGFATLATSSDDPSGNFESTSSYMSNFTDDSTHDTEVIVVAELLTAQILDRGIMRFDLSTIPLGATIDTAILKLYIYNIEQISYLQFFRVTPARGWLEAQVTWNNYTTSVPWTTPGGDFNVTDMSFQERVSTQGWYNITDASLLSDVQDMVTNPVNNSGWILKLDEIEVITHYLYVVSDDATGGNLTNRPILSLTWTYSADSGRVTGGDAFELYAYSYSWAQANATYRKLQNVHGYVRLEGDKIQFDTEEGDPRNFTLGMYYCPPDSDDFIEGWKVTMVPNNVTKSWIGETWFVGMDAYFITWNCSWFNRNATSGTWELAKTDVMASFPVWQQDGWNASRFYTAFWFDFWFNSINGSSVIGGRINAEHYGISTGTGIFGFEFDAYLGNVTQSMFFEDLHNEAGDIISAKEIKLMKFFTRIEQGNNTARNTLLILKDYDVLDFIRARGDMVGVATPIVTATKMPEVGSFGFLAALAGVFRSVGSSIISALTWGAVEAWNGLVSFLDTIGSFLGVPFAFSNFMGYITVMFEYIADGMVYLGTMLTSIFNFFLGPVVDFLSFIGQFFTSIIRTLSTMVDVMRGVAGGGVDILTYFPIEDLITLFFTMSVPIYFLQKFGDEGIGGVWRSVNTILDILTYFVSFFMSIVTFVIGLITSVIESIPVVE